MTTPARGRHWRNAGLIAAAQIALFLAAAALTAHALGGARVLAERLRAPDAFIVWELVLGLAAAGAASLLLTAAFDKALRAVLGAQTLSGRRALWFAACALAAGLALAAAFSAVTLAPLRAEAMGQAPGVSHAAWQAGFALVQMAAIAGAVLLRVRARRPRGAVDAERRA